MSQFYFFTDISLLSNQTAAQAFGPVAGALDTQYRVTSLHTATADATAYAVTSGLVQIQNVTGSASLVNLILKPDGGSLLNGVKVKYYIYRGVQLNSLLDGSAITSTQTLDLVKTIWTEQQKQKTKGTPAADILLKTITNKTADKQTIEDLFTKTTTSFVQPKVKAGDSIGVFAANSIGFEIVLDEYGLDNNISNAYTLDHVFTASSISGTPTYAQKKQREQVLYYLDPAAFYGKAYGTTTGFTSYNAGNKETIVNSTNYESIIQRTFFNNNVVYLDIRHDTQCSYPYYKDYSVTIDMSFYDASNQSLASTAASTAYCTNSWPIYRLEQTTPLQTGMLNYRFNIYLTLSIDDAAKNGTFYLPDDRRFDASLKAEYTNTNGKNQFVKTRVAANNQNKIVQISNDKFIISTYVASNKNISTYNKFVFSSDYRSSTPLPSTHYIDNLFPINVNETLPNPAIAAGNVTMKHVGYSTYVSYTQKKLATGEVANQDIVSGMYDSCIAFDHNRVTLYAVPNTFADVNQPCDISHQFGDTTRKLPTFLNYAQNVLPSNVILRKQVSLTSGGNATFVEFGDERYYARKTNTSKLNFMAIALKNNEYQKILNIINNPVNHFDTTVHPVFLQRNYATSATEDVIVNNTVAYKQIGLQVAGLNSSGALVTIDTGITIYSSDGVVYSSALDSTEYVTTVRVGKYSLTLSEAIQNDAQLSHIFQRIIYSKYFNQCISRIFKAHGSRSLTLTIDVVSSLNTIPRYQNFSASAVTDVQNNNMNELLILFDKSYITNDIDCEVVRVLYHELVHAYINALVKTLTITYNPSKETSGEAFFNYNYPNKKNKNLRNCLLKYDLKLGERNLNSDTNKLMCGDHNYMAMYQRPNIVRGMKEYNDLIEVSDLSGSVNYEDIFNGNLLTNETYTTEELYQALAWGGLFVIADVDKTTGSLILKVNRATYAFRKFASLHKHKALKLLMIKLTVEKTRMLDQNWYNATQGYYITHNFITQDIFSL